MDIAFPLGLGLHTAALAYFFDKAQNQRLYLYLGNSDGSNRLRNFRVRKIEQILDIRSYVGYIYYGILSLFFVQVRLKKLE